MMSRPARYSAAVAGSSGCAGVAWSAWSGSFVSFVSSRRTAVSVMADLPVELIRSPVAVADPATGLDGLLVGDDRADPVAEAGVAPDQPHGVEDGHDHDAQRRVREPVVGLGLTGFDQVVDRDRDRDHAQDGQRDVLEDVELGRTVLPVV